VFDPLVTARGSESLSRERGGEMFIERDSFLYFSFW
jgi:hypothetical protein